MAFAGVVIPIWVFTFGQIVFETEYLAASYSSFFWNVIYMLIPLSMGVLIQYVYPSSMKFATASIMWIINIYVISYIVYMIIRNWYMFDPDLFDFTLPVSEQTLVFLFIYILTLIQVEFQYFNFFCKFSFISVFPFCLPIAILSIHIWLVDRDKSQR